MDLADWKNLFILSRTNLEYFFLKAFGERFKFMVFYWKNSPFFGQKFIQTESFEKHSILNEMTFLWFKASLFLFGWESFGKPDCSARSMSCCLENYWVSLFFSQFPVWSFSQNIFINQLKLTNYLKLNNKITDINFKKTSQ